MQVTPFDLFPQTYHIESISIFRERLILWDIPFILSPMRFSENRKDKPMRWEDLTGDQFPEAVKQAESVCLLPLSCIERHGHHLPLGTDMFIGRELCRRVAVLEPAVIFPDYFFTQILEARHTTGTFGIEPELIIRLLENICREIARNGLTKIVIVNAHGGNDHLINYFAQIQLASRRDYVVYIPQPSYLAEEPSTAAQWETVIDGHAGERETSMILAIQPELVRSESMPADGEGMPLGRLKPLSDQGTIRRHLVVCRQSHPLLR